MKTSIMFARLVILVFWLTMALPVNLVGAQFLTGDLAGTWYLYFFGDSPAFNDPVWRRGTITMSSIGTVTGGSLVDSDGSSSPLTGGSFSLSSNGVISGSFIRNQGGINHTSSITQGKLDASKTMGSFVVTDDGGYRNVVIAIKDGGVFATADSAGTWYWYDFADSPAVNHPVWSRGIMTMDSSGTITSGTAEDSDGGVSTSGGQFSLSSNGVISGSFIRNQGGINHTSSITQGKLDASKTMGSFVFTDDGEFRNVVTVIKDGGTFATADLAGTWYWYDFADSPAANNPVWSRGTMTMDSSGTITGGTAEDSDVSSSTVTGGSFSLSSDGVISGSFTINSHTSSFSQGKMDINKSMGSFVFTDYGGYRNVAIVIKDTSSDLGPLVINAPSLPAGEVGVQYDVGLDVSGGAPPYSLSVTKGSLPIGLSFFGEDIVGTPTAAGKKSFTIKVTDHLLASVSKKFTVTINKAQIISTSNLKAGTSGRSYKAALKVSGGRKPYSWSWISGPVPGLSLTATGQITGIPTTPGTYPCTFQVTDPLGGVAKKTLTLTIK